MIGQVTKVFDTKSGVSKSGKTWHLTKVAVGDVYVSLFEKEVAEGAWIAYKEDGEYKN